VGILRHNNDLCPTVVHRSQLTYCVHNGKLEIMFIGRDYELGQIKEKLRDTSRAQLIVLYGRRRVGKSRLIREAIKKEKNVLFFEGIEGEPTTIQIDQFLNDLSYQTKKLKLAAKNWREVFQGLEETIGTGRWIVFIDELPWLAAEKTSLISELKLYWDRWSTKNPKLVLFLCGSVANFMVKHVIHSKALHNRKTLEICLPPLGPKESSDFIKKCGLREKAVLYMCLGGIPKYLEQIDPKISIESNLNRLCFTKDGFFLTEFETLFKEQFRSIHYYEAIVKSLSNGPLNLSEISRITKLEKGGGLKNYLNNLERASFIKEYQTISFGKNSGVRTKTYKLIDPFLVFYFHFIEPNKKIIAKNKEYNLFESITNKNLSVYLGLQFERLCEDSLLVILKLINIKLTDLKNFGPFFQQKTNRGPGLQFDMVLELTNGSIHLLEFKFRETPAGVSMINEMKTKIERMNFSPNITIEKTLISMNGFTKELIKANYFDHLLTLKDLY